ncbi:MAG: NADP-dependent oxidoreductase [Caulobacteraceae bacterium]
MKAVRIHSFGGPEVLVVEDIPTPKPAQGEVLVRVGAASVNPVDYKMREGKFPDLTERDLPAGLGRDICGVIEEIGPNVEGVVPGEPIFAHLGWEHAGYAEYAIVKVGQFAPKPETLTLIDAASLPLATTTAWQGLFDHGGLKAGQRVLIHGASGGVGYLAVQFAKLKGAYVFATAGAANLDWVKSLGADEVIDYKAQRFEDVAKDIDLVFDLQGGETRDRSWQTLAPGGRLVTTVHGEVVAEGKAHDRLGIAYMAEPKGEQLREAGQMADDGKLQVMVDRVFALEDVQAAHAYAEHNHPRGKVVLEVR